MLSYYGYIELSFMLYITNMMYTTAVLAHSEDNNRANTLLRSNRQNRLYPPVSKARIIQGLF